MPLPPHHGNNYYIRLRCIHIRVYIAFYHQGWYFTVLSGKPLRIIIANFSVHCILDICFWNGNKKIADNKSVTQLAFSGFRLNTICGYHRLFFFCTKTNKYTRIAITGIVQF